jgi:Protein of unknown function with PCYCGC motif
VNKKIGVLILILGLSVAVVALLSSKSSTENVVASRPAAEPHASHGSPPTKPTRVPAFQTAAASKDLGPTLTPDKFIGKTREAYKVAKQIPATLAQLPCYCECDRGYGHKSLHSCFEDDHAAHCAVCVDEALLAYQLQTQRKMSPEQVRDLIIEKYSQAN